MSPSDLREQLQSALGNSYSLKHELGGGGMARVFVATETALGRHVVLKVLSGEAAATVDAERFRREVQLAARLQHPHVVPLLAAGEAGGLLYYAMPFVQGESLRARLAREGALPLADAARLTRELADALAYAHASGVVHRDLKPENVLLSHGHAVIADFGIAKALQASRTADGLAGGTLTQWGIALGTPAYMAPEQALGDGVDHRADLYALGVVAYELLAGAHPYGARTPQQFVVAHLAESPRPVLDRRPETPPALAALVMRLLEKEPDDRPQSAGEVLQTLDAFATPAGGAARAEPLSGPTDPATGATAPREAAVPGPRGWRHLARRPAGLAAVLALVVAAGSIGWGVVHARDRTAADGDPVRLAVLPFRETGGDSGGATYLADGMTEAITARLATLPELEVIDPASTAAYRTTRTPTQEIGRELDVAYVLTGTVRWTPRVGGAPTARVTPTLVRTTGRGSVVWSGETYVVPASDPFTAQAEIAREVADALELALTPDKRQALAAGPTANAEAYDHYLRGRDAYRRWDGFPRRGDLLQIAVEQFRLATRRDTTFALAYASLAQSLLMLSRPPSNPETRSELLREFHAALDHARRLDPNLPEAVVAHGEYLLWEVRDPKRAFEEFDRASGLRPNDAALLMRRLRSVGPLQEWTDAEFERDAALIERAVRLDPRSGETLFAMFRTLERQRRYAEAEAYATRAMELDPESGDTYRLVARAALLANGDTARARTVLEAALRNAQSPHLALQGMGHMAGDGFARAVDTLDIDHVVKGVRQTAFDTARLFMLKLDAARSVGRASAARGYADSARRVLESPAYRVGPEVELAFVNAVLGRTEEATRLLRRRGAHLDSLVARRSSLGATLNARRIEGSVGYELARTAALLGDVPELQRRLAAALRAPGGVTPAYVRLDHAFHAWRGRPEFEAVLAAAPSPAPRPARR